jgi:sugar lactone lactonase YvrE
LHEENKVRQVGSGKFVYMELKEWGEFPEGWVAHDVAAVAVDSQDNVHVFTRNGAGDCVVVFDREGQMLGSWGAGLFKRPHGISIGPDDAIYCVDDWGHAVHKFTTDGKLLMSIETAANPADTGYVWDRPETVLRSGPPFNHPTHVAVSPEGTLYVTDGYGNARVHKFAPDGRLLLSWGEPGNGPGEFVIPHSVCVDNAGLVYVADRMNSRIQVFTPDGKLVGVWPEIRRPDDLCLDAEGNVYIAELGNVVQGEIGARQAVVSGLAGRITVRDLSGRLLAEWGEPDPQGTDLYYCPHGIAVDSRGDLYVSEVPEAYSGGQRLPTRPALRKYVRV